MISNRSVTLDMPVASGIESSEMLTSFPLRAEIQDSRFLRVPSMSSMRGVGRVSSTERLLGVSESVR